MWRVMIVGVAVLLIACQAASGDLAAWQKFQEDMNGSDAQMHRDAVQHMTSAIANSDTNGVIAAVTDAVSAGNGLLAGLDAAETRPCYAAAAAAIREMMVANRDGYSLMLQYLTSPTEPETTYDQANAKIDAGVKLTSVVLDRSREVVCNP